MTARRVLATLAATVAPLAAAAVVVASPAAAATREHVCADSLYVRSAPGSAVIGTLYRDNSFDFDHYNSAHTYAYGYAYGGVNKWGWVSAGYFC